MARFRKQFSTALPYFEGKIHIKLPFNIIVEILFPDSICENRKKIPD